MPWQAVPAIPSLDSNHKALWATTACSVMHSLRNEKNNNKSKMTRHCTIITVEKLHRLVAKVVVKYISEVMYVKPFGIVGRMPEWNNHPRKSNWRSSHLSRPYAGTLASLLLRYQPGPKYSFTTAKASLNSTTFKRSFLHTSTEDKMRLSEASGLWRAQQSFCHGSTIPLDI